MLTDVAVIVELEIEFMINTLLRFEGLARLFSTASPLYKFQYHTCMIPHPSKAGKGGQDALFAQDNLLVVADGVGGWAEVGVDPGIFSRRLCKIIADIYMKDKDRYYDNPGELIPLAVRQNKEVGTSTICILALHPYTGKISASYIGDSVYSIFRKQSSYKLYFQAQQHQRQFNFPYQVGTDGDNPTQSVRLSTQSQADDIVVVGSDGLWDNLQSSVIENLINTTSQQKLVQAIARTAYAKSLSYNYESPFARKAKKAGFHYPNSGKPDDITVVAAKVVKQNLGDARSDNK